jgi:hypothetical protein
MGERAAGKDWRKFEGAKERLKQVLLKSGVPLEAQVLRIFRFWRKRCAK